MSRCCCDYLRSLCYVYFVISMPRYAYLGGVLGGLCRIMWNVHVWCSWGLFSEYFGQVDTL